MRRWQAIVCALLLLTSLAGGSASVVGMAEGWSSRAPMGTARAGHTATTLPDGRVLVTGGLQRTVRGYTASAELYDPVGDRWVPAAAMSAPRYGHKAVVLPDGRVLIIGTGGGEIYDPASDRWRATAPEPPGQILTNAALLPDGQVLVIGNYQAWRFDPRADRWTALSANGYLGQQSVTLLPSGKVLITGGSRASGAKLGSGWSNAAELYDPVTDRLTSVRSMATVHVGHSALLLGDGRVLVVGGGGATQDSPLPELYDPRGDRWSAAALPPLSRIGGAIVLHDGRALAIGGDGAAIYDPAADCWSVIAGPDTPRASAPLTLLRDGRVLLAGGSSTSPDLALDTVESFMPPGGATQRCFAETGQCVAGRFLDYWLANGGLARNGFPLTPERRELLEDGKEYLVQYFERVRLEYHPENAPPYDVLLGFFGRRVERAQFGGANNAVALFEQALAPAPPLAGASYFAETGHNLGGRFRDYWLANGGLAQFGFPITEERRERLEDGNDYTVQYFERARLEYHPENVSPYDVLLGQFGRRIAGEAAILTGDFGRLYLTDQGLRDRLGAPAEGTQAMAGATQTFERGRMFYLSEFVTTYWGGNAPTIYVLVGGEQSGALQPYLTRLGWPDTWREGEDPGGGAGPRPGLFVPRRGFGKVWRFGVGLYNAGGPPDSTLREQLGYATTANEEGYPLVAQRFQGGLLLSTPDGRAAYTIFVNQVSNGSAPRAVYERRALPGR